MFTVSLRLADGLRISNFTRLSFSWNAQNGRSKLVIEIQGQLSFKLQNNSISLKALYRFGQYSQAVWYNLLQIPPISGKRKPRTCAKVLRWDVCPCKDHVKTHALAPWLRWINQRTRQWRFNETSLYLAISCSDPVQFGDRVEEQLSQSARTG